MIRTWRCPRVSSLSQVRFTLAQLTLCSGRTSEAVSEAKSSFCIANKAEDNKQCLI